MLSLFNKTVDILSGMLNYREKRHQVILSNIANLDVPDYQATDLVMKNAGAGGKTCHRPSGSKRPIAAISHLRGSPWNPPVIAS